MKSLRALLLTFGLATLPAQAQEARFVDEADPDIARLSAIRFGPDHDLYAYDGERWLNICDPAVRDINRRAIVLKNADKLIADKVASAKITQATHHEITVDLGVEADAWVMSSWKFFEDLNALKDIFAATKAGGQDVENPETKMRIYAEYSGNAYLNSEIERLTHIGNDQAFCGFRRDHKALTIERQERAQGPRWKYPRLTELDIHNP